MKEAHFRIRNLTQDEYTSLKNLAIQLTGKPSIATLAKQLILEKLGKHNNKLPEEKAENQGQRIEVRLQSPDLKELKERARQSNMTANRYLAMLFQAHTQKAPVLSTKEIEALYQSNAQLLRIGRNLNQIAKALNAGSQTAISTRLLNNIKDELDTHTEQVADVIRANWERMP